MMKYVYIGLILTMLLSISCSIEEFEAPEFDKKITLPLTNEVYYAADIADTTDDYMVYVGNDTMMFSIDDDFDTEYVDEEDLRIDGQVEDFDTELGEELMLESREETTEVEVGDDLVLDSQEKLIEQSLNNIEVEESGEAFAFIDILAFAAEAIDEPVEPITGEVIPPYYDFEPFNRDFSLFENDNFEYVVIDTGSVYVNFYNNTELALSSNLGEEYQMHFDFYTNGTAEEDNGTFLFTHYVDNVIGPGDLENIVIPFDGNMVYQTNYLKSYLTTDGSDGPINVTEDDFFEVTFWVGNMTISEANAEIEEAEVDHQSGLLLEDEDISIISAEIYECTGLVTISNDLALDIDTLRLDFAELYTPENQPYSIEVYDILQGTEMQIPLNLDGFIIESDNGQPLDSLSINLFATTDPPPGFTVVNENDNVSAHIELGEMTFSNLTGIVDQISEKTDSLDISDEDFTIVDAVIDAGTIHIDFSGIDIEAPSTVEIYFDEIIDPATSDNLVITIDNFENIEHNLAGHEIILDDEQIIHYTAVVHLNQQITISNNDTATAEILLEDIYFESVSGMFESFEFDDSGAAEIDSTGEFSLYYARIHECLLQINIPPATYPLPFGADLDLSFEDIYTPEGELYSISFHCPGDTVIDLSGFSLGYNPESQAVIDSLYYSYIVTTDASDEIMTVYGDDTIEAEIVIDDIVFEHISGILDSREVELDDITEDIDMDDLPDSLAGLLEFQAVELHLDIFNQTGFDCRLVMDITARNDDGDAVSIAVDETVYAASTTNIIITDGVNEMLDIIPNHIDITNLIAYVGDGQTPGYIALNDSISGSYSVVSPMQFIVNDHLVTKTTDGEELDEDDQDIIEDNLESAKVTVLAENVFPFGVDVSLFLANDSLEIFTNPGLVIDSLYLAPAEMIAGEVHPTTSEIIVELSGSDYDVFLDRENPFFYPGVELFIHGSNGEVVTILGTDKITVTGLLEVVVHVVEEEDE